MVISVNAVEGVLPAEPCEILTYTIYVNISRWKHSPAKSGCLSEASAPIKKKGSNLSRFDKIPALHYLHSIKVEGCSYGKLHP
jgi:hypothetical protein